MPHVSPGPTCAAVSKMVHGDPCFLMLCLYSVGFMVIGPRDFAFTCQFAFEKPSPNNPQFLHVRSIAMKLE